MTDKTIGLGTSKYNFDYMVLYFSRRSPFKLDYYLNQFDINDYHIMYLYIQNPRLVSIEEFLEFNNSGYILYKKDKYDLKHIELWIKFLNTKIIKGQFIDKPFPPFDPNKIKIIDRYD